MIRTNLVDLAYVRLTIAYRALERFREAMDYKHGDLRLRDSDTIAYLDGIDAAMSADEHLERKRLSRARADATRLADEATIERVIREWEAHCIGCVEREVAP